MYVNFTENRVSTSTPKADREVEDLWNQGKTDTLSGVYCELLAGNWEFSLPHSHLTSSLGVNPFEFLDGFF